mmetsp:Transcript_9303/g.23688  ORF Transcript_9303/g.23688 Transcript_9303/m.23688 type:complete len:302 (+) Transcript_9303:361-1266(+)
MARKCKSSLERKVVGKDGQSNTPAIRLRNKELVALEASVKVDDAHHAAAISAFEADGWHIFSTARLVAGFVGKHLPAYRFSYASFNQWVLGKTNFRAKRGRLPYLDTVLERRLAELALAIDSDGFPFTSARLISLAKEAFEGSAHAKYFSKDGPGESRAEGWFSRIQEFYPDLIRARARGRTAATNTWYNSDNINWWYDKLAECVRKYGLGESDEGLQGEEFDWKDPKRVIITDETAIIGCNFFGSGERSAKVITTRDKLEGGKNGNGQRRVSRSKDDFDRHITLSPVTTLLDMPCSQHGF